MEKPASECDGGTSAPKKTVYILGTRTPTVKKSSLRRVAADLSVLLCSIMSAGYIQLIASPALPSPGSPEKARRDSCTIMPNRGDTVWIQKEIHVVLLKEIANSAKGNRGDFHICVGGRERQPALKHAVVGKRSFRNPRCVSNHRRLVDGVFENRY